MGLRSDFVIPGAGLFPGLRDGARRFPITLSGVFASEFSVESARGEDEARTFLPALFPLLEFAGARLFRMAGFAFLPMPAIEIEGQASLYPRCPRLPAGF